jgi:hypothetical protein
MAKSAYWPLFWVENVWHLTGNIANDVEEAWVVFISNAARRVAVWSQAAANPPSRPVVWDYHVILLESTAAGWRVTDPDSSLETPIDARSYLNASFHSIGDELGGLRPMFRVVRAQEYRSLLRSDRNHMRSSTGSSIGEWLAPPPPRPPIGQDANGSGRPGSNLMQFVDMERPFVGQVCDLDGLLLRIGVN